jgi:HAD superfamily hydrolase (TIGR01549 family)
MWRAYQRGEIDPASLSRERFRQLLAEIGHDVAGCDALGAAYLQAIASRGDLVRGARSVLAAVARRARLGAVTNGIGPIQHARLRAAGIARRFEVVVTSDEAGYAKPDPRILQAAFRALGVEASETAYVGDDPYADGEAARAAGARFWWLDRGLGGRPPQAMEHRITSIRYVMALLDPS